MKPRLLIMVVLCLVAAAPATQPSTAPTQTIRNGRHAWSMIPEKYHPKGRDEWADRSTADGIARERAASARCDIKAKIVSVESTVNDDETVAIIGGAVEKVSESRRMAFYVEERVVIKMPPSKAAPIVDELKGLRNRGKQYNFAAPIRDVAFEIKVDERTTTKRRMNPDMGISAETTTAQVRFWTMVLKTERTVAP